MRLEIHIVDLVRTQTKLTIYHSIESGSGYVAPPVQKWIQLALLYGLGKAFHIKRRCGLSQVSLWYYHTSTISYAWYTISRCQ